MGCVPRSSHCVCPVRISVGILRGVALPAQSFRPNGGRASPCKPDLPFFSCLERPHSAAARHNNCVVATQLCCGHITRCCGHTHSLVWIPHKDSGPNRAPGALGPQGPPRGSPEAPQGPQGPGEAGGSDSGHFRKKSFSGPGPESEARTQILDFQTRPGDFPGDWWTSPENGETSPETVRRPQGPPRSPGRPGGAPALNGKIQLQSKQMCVHSCYTIKSISGYLQ